MSVINTVTYRGMKLIWGLQLKELVITMPFDIVAEYILGRAIGIRLNGGILKIICPVHRAVSLNVEFKSDVCRRRTCPLGFAARDDDKSTP